MDNQIVLEWFRYGDNDLAAAEHMLSLYPLQMEIICYHSHQAVEKWLKGYIISKTGNDPQRTHDLIRLCAQCQSFDCSYDRIMDFCEVLTRYGVQPRYPNELYIDEPLMRKALECARQIKDFAPLKEARTSLESAEQENP